MNGPECAQYMRQQLGYAGPIIGRYPSFLPRHHHSQRMKLIDFSFFLFCIAFSQFFFLLLNSGVTGNALPEDIAKFMACGANEVLTKPLTREKLMKSLSTYADL